MCFTAFHPNPFSYISTLELVTKYLSKANIFIQSSLIKSAIAFPLFKIKIHIINMACGICHLSTFLVSFGFYFSLFLCILTNLAFLQAFK